MRKNSVILRLETEIATMSTSNNQLPQMPPTAPEWFNTWFNTPYYHLLYRERNDQEAHQFMDTLTAYLNLEPGISILDLACGKGRHAKYLHDLGFQVTGLDLSEASIKEASEFSTEGLVFKQHDMREPIGQQFDAVFNLFTSFGYFSDDNDHVKALQSIQGALAENGLAVIDFMNMAWVLEQLVPEEHKTVDDITFCIKRFTQDGFLYKHISFEDQGQTFDFHERVRTFSLSDFETMFDQAGLTLLAVFGNYKLHPFHAANSERLIMLLM